jgi:DNA-binding CsgD family transcriptional regulator
MSLPRFGRYLPRCTARLMTPKVGTAFNILLDASPCSACDKMRLGHLRFPHGNRAHESQDSDRTKATTGPARLGRNRLRHIGKARDLFPRRWSRSLRRWPRTSFATLPALDQRRDAAALCKLRETAATCVASLTSRQRQILDLVLAGHPSKNIAADLGISPHTVYNHRAAIMRKTGSRSRLALIRTAMAAA